jgi:hypothetical protein
LLWVRCRNLDQALRATDLLIQGGGFGLVAVDLSDVSPRTVRHVPLNAWFRFRRAVEDTPTILMVVEQEAHAKTCASLVLRVDAGPARWSMAVETTEPNCSGYPFARLLRGFPVCTEVMRSRLQSPVEIFSEHRFGGSNATGKAEIFETEAMWPIGNDMELSDYRG